MTIPKPHIRPLNPFLQPSLQIPITGSHDLFPVQYVSHRFLQSSPNRPEGHSMKQHILRDNSSQIQVFFSNIS